MTGGGRGGKPKAGFPPRPPPLEIAKGALPTFPLSLPDKLVQTQKTRKRTGCGGKVEIQNRDSHFSTAPNACGARKGNPTLLAGGIGHTRITHQKGGPAAVASLPPSGSFFNENMLGNERECRCNGSAQQILSRKSFLTARRRFSMPKMRPFTL